METALLPVHKLLAEFNNCTLKDLLKVFMILLHILKYVYTLHPRKINVQNCSV